MLDEAMRKLRQFEQGLSQESGESMHHVSGQTAQCSEA